MTATKKEELEKNRKEATLRNTLFNRYLLFRYSLSLFFFANLYWLLIQFIRMSAYILVPLALLLLTVLALAEQFRLYGRKEVDLTKTNFFFWCQFVTQLVSILAVLFSSHYTSIFPIFSNTQISRYFVAILLALGALISLVNLRKVKKISQNRDRAYILYQKLEKSI